jgi:hypothetical protein
MTLLLTREGTSCDTLSWLARYLFLLGELPTYASLQATSDLYFSKMPQFKTLSKYISVGFGKLNSSIPIPKPIA